MITALMILAIYAVGVFLFIRFMGFTHDCDEDIKRTMKRGLPRSKP